MPPKRKNAETFDEHLGAIVEGLAQPHGGREFLETLLPWSMPTVIRRITGKNGFLVNELIAVAEALHTSSAALVSQALKNYAGGSEEQGVSKLLREGEVMSDSPISLDAHRASKGALPGSTTPRRDDKDKSARQEDAARKTVAELEAITKRAATYDPELESDTPVD